MEYYGVLRNTELAPTLLTQDCDWSANPRKIAADHNMSAAAMCQRANSKTSEFTHFSPKPSPRTWSTSVMQTFQSAAPAAGMAEAGAGGGDTDLEESAVFETDNGC